MSHTIKITKCDNELIIVAFNRNGSNSYRIGHILSGNSNTVDVDITISKGDDYKGPKECELHGVNHPISKAYTVELPKGTYTVVAVGINWGGPWAFEFDIGKTHYAIAGKERVGMVYCLDDAKIQV